MFVWRNICKIGLLTVSLWFWVRLFSILCLSMSTSLSLFPLPLWLPLTLPISLPPYSLCHCLSFCLLARSPTIPDVCVKVCVYHWFDLYMWCHLLIKSVPFPLFQAQTQYCIWQRLIAHVTNYYVTRCVLICHYIVCKQVCIQLGHDISFVLCELHRNNNCLLLMYATSQLFSQNTQRENKFLER